MIVLTAAPRIRTNPLPSDRDRGKIEMFERSLVGR
jgi:hypothetical protein